MTEESMLGKIAEKLNPSATTAAPTAEDHEREIERIDAARAARRQAHADASEASRRAAAEREAARAAYEGNPSSDALARMRESEALARQAHANERAAATALTPHEEVLEERERAGHVAGLVMALKLEIGSHRVIASGEVASWIRAFASLGSVIGQAAPRAIEAHAKQAKLDRLERRGGNDPNNPDYQKRMMGSVGDIFPLLVAAALAGGAEERDLFAVLRGVLNDGSHGRHVVTEEHRTIVTKVLSTTKTKV